MNSLFKIFIVNLFFFAFTNQVLKAQCKDISFALKAMNNKDIDSSISLLKKAEEKIIDNGLESIDDKCLAKYYYAKGAGFLIKGQREDSLKVKLNWFEQSANNYKKFIQLDEQPSDYEALVNSNINSLGVEFMNIGINYYEEKNYQQAHKYIGLGMELKRAVTPVDISEQEYFNALVCAKLAQEYQSALIYADSLLSQQGLSLVRESKYLNQKAEVLVAMGNTDQALEVISLLEEINPRDINPKLSKLQIFLDKNQNDSALIVLNEITSIKSDRDDLWVLKAQLNYQKENVEQSKKDFTKALQLNPKNTTALYGLSVIHVNEGNKLVQLARDTNDEIAAKEYHSEAKSEFSMAAAYLNKIIVIDPTNEKALLALKDIYNAIDDNESKSIINSKLSDLKGIK